ncbi:hypothetical protein L3V82_07960 [Thiotrichales bacterium 19S3-7]|nr:hypothetical protein [Thiotrichales bacterium 19S3-7]MCF6802094.1 hypothetical protein [Thiotrichales bacterium 19S3-11]
MSKTFYIASLRTNDATCYNNKMTEQQFHNYIVGRKNSITIRKIEYSSSEIALLQSKKFPMTYKDEIKFIIEMDTASNNTICVRYSPEISFITSKSNIFDNQPNNNTIKQTAPFYEKSLTNTNSSENDNSSQDESDIIPSSNNKCCAIQ